MTMDDLISRAALLKECAGCQKTDPHFEERGWADHFINSAGEPSTEWYCVEDMIENAPAVDAVPRWWLENMMLEREAEESRAAWLVMREWQREREAK
jgi:hypothetical protein